MISDHNTVWHISFPWHGGWDTSIQKVMSWSCNQCNRARYISLKVSKSTGYLKSLNYIYLTNNPKCTPKTICISSYPTISTMTEAIVLNVKNTTRQIPKVRVIRHLLNGTTINMLVNVTNNETVETSRVGEICTWYSPSDKFMINPDTPTPSRISAPLEVQKGGAGRSTQHWTAETGGHRHHWKSHLCDRHVRHEIW